MSHDINVIRNVDQDDNDNSASNAERKFEILVIGAGIAGLSFVYGLRRSALYKEGKVGCRIVEKRDGAGTDLGYPIHLSSAARKSLESLLSPSDLLRLHSARSKIPVHHDGITVSSYKGRKAWRTVREPGTRPMIEREELMGILRDGVGQVEYGLEVVSFSEKEGGVDVGLKGREGRREEVKMDLVVGADGMFSQTRQSLIPHSDALEKLPWTIINSRTSSSDVLRWLKDPHGINTIYGDSFSATMIPLSSVVNSGDEVGVDKDRHVLSPVAEDEEGRDEKCTKGDGSITQDDDNTLNVHQGIKQTNTIDGTTPKPNTDNAPGSTKESSTDHPISSSPTNLNTAHTNPTTTHEASQVYVALTVPSKWLTPSYCHQMSKCTCEPTVHSLFLRNLEYSDGWARRKGYQMYSMKWTFAGRGRVVLLGDAAHGMPPFCGAGAGSAVVDACELIRGLEDGLGGLADIDNTLHEFRTQSQFRNDPLIKESKSLLWLAQGETELSMLARKVVFWGLEMKEVLSGKREKLEEQLRKSIEEDENKGIR